MRTVIQRVSEAAVRVPAEGYENTIGQGLLVLAAFIDEDTDEDLVWTARKIAAMRIFDDENGVMNMRYSSLNSHTLAVLLVLAILNVPGEFETYSCEDTQSAASVVYGYSMNVITEDIRGFAFACFQKGEVEYLNENFETVTLNVEPNNVYVITKENGAITVAKYFGAELRKLIAEGI